MTADRDDRDADGAVRPGTDRLLCDLMLGKLAVYLRLCGFDAAYAGDRGVEDDDRLRRLAREEGRILLSRDAELVARTADAIRLTELDVAGQLAELRAAGVELTVADRPSRCGRCNAPVEPVPDGASRPDYAPAPGEFDCWRCTACGQHFWKGSHWDRMRELL